MAERTDTPNLKWLDDAGVFRVNRMDAHSDHRFFKNETEVQEEKSSFELLLNGEWLFHYSVNAKERPAGFYRLSADEVRALGANDGFGSIAVPAHIEIAGFDKLHYINSLYPWEGHIFRRPLDRDGNAALTGSFAEADYNPVGSYIRTFDLPEAMRGHNIRIRLEGVEQAAFVYLNGTFIGYCEDSFTPSEFDLTQFIRDKDNVLAIEVHKRSTAAFLEDQDFFRFFGIFRDVKLLATPSVHAEDLDIRPVLDADNTSGSLTVTTKIYGPGELGRLHIRLADAENKIVAECDSDTDVIKFELSEVTPWEHKNPYLYTLTVSVYDDADVLQEIIPYRIGFRRIEIRDRVVYLNGKRLYLCGVNRHEWNPESGRVIGLDDMRADLEIFRRNHINAVRTCHYPDRIEWYGLCDEAGIYMMAETNLESHGSWQKLGGIENSWNIPGDNEVYTQAVLDRAKSNYEWFKNHTAVLFWSLGNESFVGRGLEAMNAFFKGQQDGRLTHYEGVWVNRDYEDTVSDVESRMYETPEGVREYLQKEPKKPFLLCEYMHCMGNSLGGFDSYMKLFDGFESFCGGFIWDYIDQALYVTDEVTGERVLRYGGDFDDRAADYEFSQNGIVFADRSEKPAMQEVRYFYGKYGA